MRYPSKSNTPPLDRIMERLTEEAYSTQRGIDYYEDRIEQFPQGHPHSEVLADSLRMHRQSLDQVNEEITALRLLLG